MAQLGDGQVAYGTTSETEVMPQGVATSGCGPRGLLWSLHAERQARAAAAARRKEIVAPQTLPKDSSRQWSSAETCGCVHPPRSVCNACGGHPEVQLPWALYSTLDSAFAAVGKMPRPHVSETNDGSTRSLRALVAGEMTWQGAAAMFDWALALVNAGRGQFRASGLTFLDCGAGHGRAIALFAALHGPAHGYEIRPTVASTAAAALARLQEAQPSADEAPNQGYTCTGGSVVDDARGSRHEWAGPASVSCRDMFAPGVSWHADVVLVNATGFDDWLVAESVRKLEETQVEQVAGGGQGTTRGRQRAVLSLSQPLHSSCLRLEGQRTFAVSWGQCTTYLYSMG